MTTTLNGDCLDVLKTLDNESVHCCVTSPPYWGLRSYLPADHPDKHKEIGMEKTPEEYVAKLVAVFREVRRVLRSDGVCWLNLGDSYGAKGGSTAMTGGKNDAARGVALGFGSLPPTNTGLRPKNLVGIPWRVAFALQADGWWLRQDIIWAKPNPMPESVTDRCTKAHEYVFLLAKSERYWYDAEAVKEAQEKTAGSISVRSFAYQEENSDPKGGGYRGDGGLAGRVNTGTRNRRSVWTVATQPYSGAHFATFPPALIEPMILAGCPAQACPTCGMGWERVVERERTKDPTRHTGRAVVGCADRRDGDEPRMLTRITTLGHRPACTCPPADPIPGVVLDPFGGSGTTGKVASRLGRTAILIELNPEYRPMSDRRTAQSGLALA